MEKPTSKHFGDWPTTAGFQAEAEQRSPIELKVTGRFPAAVAGTLLRTGPATHREGDFKLSHWFDGFSQVYRFQLIPQSDGTCKVLYQSRRQVDEELERVRKTGKLDGITFGQKRDPCVSIFGKLMAVFHPRASSGGPSNANVSVTIHPSMDGKVLEARTDSNALKTIDPETLEPMGVTDQSSLHPSLTGPMSSAHAQFDPKAGDCFNYNLQLGRYATYRIFRTSTASGKTDVLATITGADVPAAYLHSFFLTENHVVLCVWSAHYAAGGMKVLWERNLLDAISPFDSKVETHWYVVDRRSGKGFVKQYIGNPMFAFHTVNAYEERRPDGAVDILADVVQYPNTDMLHRLYYDNLISDGPGVPAWAKKDSCKARLARYRLSDIGTSSERAARVERIFHLPPGQAGELPTINGSRKTLSYRYMYGGSDRGKASLFDGLVKTDLHTQEATYWSREKHTPGEAIFVADPAREGQEDGGWLLSCVLDGEKGTSYLLCLDAETMGEVGKAESEVTWGIGFHGTHLSL